MTDELLLPWRERRGLLTKRSAGAVKEPSVITAALDEHGMGQRGPFSPGRPLSPTTGFSQRPRSLDFPVGSNLSLASRGTWGRTSYDTLKAIVDTYDVARMCVNHKIDELRSMELMFLPLEGDKGRDVDAAVDAARCALEFPDRQTPYIEWVSQLLENALRYDAVPLYRRRNYSGEIIGLENIDAPTVFPYIDDHGRRPKAPAPAFGQKIHGLPWTWLTTDDLSFERFRPQTDSPYGLAPMESILLTANTDLRFQWHFLQMFTEGSIPGGFIELPPEATSPDQVAEWQDYWDATVMGDQAKLHQLVAVPSGTKLLETRPQAFDKAFPQYLMARTCSAFGVVPQDLGLVDDVNRANGETQMDIQFRVNTLPWVLWLQGILTRYLRYGLGLPVQAKLDTGRNKEDRLQEAQAWDIAVKGGATSVDEWRSEVYGLPIDDERPTPRFIYSARTGPIPLASLLSVSGTINPETGGPADDVPLSVTPFEGTPGLLPDKAPGGSEFRRAPVNPDEAASPGAETGTPPAPVAKSAQDMERAAFSRYVRSPRRGGRWRDFAFSEVAPEEASRLNASGRERVLKGAASPEWERHPARRVEGELAAHHAVQVQDALAGMATPDQLKRLVDAYRASRSDA